MATAAPATLPRLKQRYLNEIRPELVRRFGYSSVMQTPRLEKITLNMGVGDAKQDTRMLEAATEQLATIAGQRPSVRRARKSIAGFKIRDGMPVGVAVTLRDARMYEFLDRLTSVAIPRIRDFRGLNPRAFDGRGNYSLGIREQIIFPEIDYDAIDQVRGLDVVITTTAATDDEAFALLAAFGLPFRQDGRPGAGGEAVERAAEEERRVAEARERAEAEAAAREELRDEDPDAYATPAGPAEEGVAGAHAEPGAAAEMTEGPGPTSEAPGATVERPDDTRAGRPGQDSPAEAEVPAAERPDEPAGEQPEAASADDAEGQPADARAPDSPDGS